MRYSSDDLRAAVSAGIINPGQLEPLLAFLATRQPAHQPRPPRNSMSCISCGTWARWS